jgi:hypothetical protein
MPDLSIETAVTCSSNVRWRRKVNGSSGKLYWVSWGLVPSGDSLYGWSCTCPDHVHRGRECRHIKASTEFRCGWNAALEPSTGLTIGDCCPVCQGPLEAFSQAV